MPDKEPRELEKRDFGRLIGRVIALPLERISPDPENLREVFDADDIKDLGLNMKRIGQLDDVTVFPKQNSEGKWTGDFDLHDGERRWRAAQMVGIPTLRAKVVERPSERELLLKRTSRALQTRVLEPEMKMEAVEKALRELGIWDKPDLWENYREQLGGGADWPQIIRTLQARPLIKQMLDDGTINFTLAQSIARLPQDRQDEAAKYVVVNKLSGRFFSTQMVPYLIENPEASLAQAFEYTRVGGWRQYTKSPYKRGEEPPTEEQIERFLGTCVEWERAWEVLVHTGLIFKIIGNTHYESRIRDTLSRIEERVQATLKKMGSANSEAETVGRILLDRKLIADASANEPDEA